MPERADNDTPQAAKTLLKKPYLRLFTMKTQDRDISSYFSGCF